MRRWPHADDPLDQGGAGGIRFWASRTTPAGNSARAAWSNLAASRTRATSGLARNSSVERAPSSNATGVRIARWSASSTTRLSSVVLLTAATAVGLRYSRSGRLFLRCTIGRAPKDGRRQLREIAPNQQTTMRFHRPRYARSERVVSWPSARLLDSHVAKVEAMEER